MDYLKHLSASGQLRFQLEKDTLQLSFLKNKTEEKKTNVFCNYYYYICTERS